MQEHVRLILACPNCGCTEWISNEDGDYVCVSCGNVEFVRQDDGRTEGLDGMVN